MDRIWLCAADRPWPIFWPTSLLNHTILFWSIKLRLTCKKVQKMATVASTESLYLCISHEIHWLVLYKQTSIKHKGTMSVKPVLIKTRIYLCIRASFNWFFSPELKNKIELIWITGCFASIHQHSLDNTSCCQGDMITVLSVFQQSITLMHFTLVFTETHTAVCRSH